MNDNHLYAEESELRRRGSNGKSIHHNLGKSQIEYCSLMSTIDDDHHLADQTNVALELKTSTIINPDYQNSLNSTTKLTSYKTTTPKKPSFIIKRSLSESSSYEANRSFQTSVQNGCISHNMWKNELSVNSDKKDAKPISQCKKRTHEKNDGKFIDNAKIIKKINSHYISDMIDVGIRIVLVLLFFKLETTAAFHRNIHVEELWLYKNPRTDDIVTPYDLILSVILSPLIISTLNFFLTRDHHDFRAANWAWTLSLCLSGITTSFMKITSGRPRPDFFYRCFPDGQMLANVTPTAVNFNCTGNWRVINEGYKSFPSGHASFAFCSFGFIAFYLAGKLHAFNTTGRGETWRLLTVIAPLWMAMLIAISRTCDYHHHSSDVIVGSLIGITVAYITYRQYFPSIFSRYSHRPLPRNVHSSLCRNAKCLKHEYRNLTIRNEDSDDHDCEINRFTENCHLSVSDDQVPLICDEEQEQGY